MRLTLRAVSFLSGVLCGEYLVVFAIAPCKQISKLGVRNLLRGLLHRDSSPQDLSCGAGELIAGANSLV
ncbi:MAG: hypothetical protein M3014_08465, partial [Chloroflexota bacterium]|nr:hypothetical protein [Chloroflexota bacterium]